MCDSCPTKVRGLQIQAELLYIGFFFTLLHLQTVSLSYDFAQTQLYQREIIRVIGIRPILNSHVDNKGENNPRAIISLHTVNISEGKFF